MQESKDKEFIVLGGGCFWCLEAVFQLIEGVIEVVPGYAGGTTKKPTYEEVCSGTTGHAEVIKLIFDPHRISLRDILSVFFSIHDPTTLNRQGHDVGPQYRSIIICQEPQQKEVVSKFIHELTVKQYFSNSIVTEVRENLPFYQAEKYHHNYYRSHQTQPYCHFVIRPKLEKIKNEFGHCLKPDE